MALDEDIPVLGRCKASDEGPHSLTLKDLGFVEAGSFEQGDLSPVSERHAEALREALALGHDLGNMR